MARHVAFIVGLGIAASAPASAQVLNPDPEGTGQKPTTQPQPTPAPTPAPTPTATPTAETPAETQPSGPETTSVPVFVRPVVAPPDGFRLRHGIAASAGEEFGSGPSSGLSGVLIGLDWRFGAQIDNNYALYADSHLSFGTAHIGANGGVTGNFAIAAMLERTIVDHFCIAAGGGYGILNNPSGPLFQARIAWYPFVSVVREYPRRRGLMIGFDLREYFGPATIGTVSQASLSLGYEKF